MLIGERSFSGFRFYCIQRKKTILILARHPYITRNVVKGTSLNTALGGKDTARNYKSSIPDTIFHFIT
jgi:hypothetical protein